MFLGSASVSGPATYLFFTIQPTSLEKRKPSDNEVSVKHRYEVFFLPVTVTLSQIGDVLTEFRRAEILDNNARYRRSGSGDPQ